MENLPNKTFKIAVYFINTESLREPPKTLNSFRRRRHEWEIKKTENREGEITKELKKQKKT